MRAKEFVVEADSYQPPELSVGDRILKGKFKNSPAEIKGFTKDKHNQPVLKTNRGEVQLFKPRVTKLMDKDVAEDRESIPSGKKRITWNGIDLVVSIDGATVDIRAMTGDSQMAYVVFDRDGDTLVADDLAVEEQYKGQGIAKIMYNYVKELGFRVKRSSDQLVAGKKFWDKNKGAENNIWEQGVAEGFPQPGPSSGAPKQFGSDAKIQTRQMTVTDIISSVPGVPYYNNVVDDWDAKKYNSWGVTKKVIEYATYLKNHPESLAKLPPAIVLNGKFEDGAHRVSAIWLLQQRMDPKNPLWENAKLNVEFVKQGVAESFGDTIPIVRRAKNAIRNIGVDKISPSVHLYRNPELKGAYVKSSKAIKDLPVTTVPISSLIMWEPESKLTGAEGSEHVAQMVQAIKQGAKLPPITVTPLATGYRIIDGHHRYGAYKLAGVKNIPVRVVDRKKVLYLEKQGNLAPKKLR